MCSYISGELPLCLPSAAPKLVGHPSSEVRCIDCRCGEKRSRALILSANLKFWRLALSGVFHVASRVSSSSMAMNLRSKGAPGYRLPSRRRVSHCVQAATGRKAARTSHQRIRLGQSHTADQEHPRYRSRSYSRTKCCLQAADQGGPENQPATDGFK